MGPQLGPEAMGYRLEGTRHSADAKARLRLGSFATELEKGSFCGARSQQRVLLRMCMPLQLRESERILDRPGSAKPTAILQASLQFAHGSLDAPSFYARS